MTIVGEMPEKFAELARPLELGGDRAYMSDPSCSLFIEAMKDRSYLQVISSEKAMQELDVRSKVACEVEMTNDGGHRLTSAAKPAGFIGPGLKTVVQKEHQAA